MVGDIESERDDGIGDSVFSKSWVLSVLVRAVESVCSVGQVEREREEEGKGGREDEKEREGGGEWEGNGERKGKQEGERVCKGEREKDGENMGKEGVEREGESEGEGKIKEEREKGGDMEREGEGDRVEDDEDLDKNLEEDLCQLWDASMNNVKSLHNYNTHLCIYNLQSFQYSQWNFSNQDTVRVS